MGTVTCALFPAQAWAQTPGIKTSHRTSSLEKFFLLAMEVHRKPKHGQIGDTRPRTLPCVVNSQDTAALVPVD